MEECWVSQANARQRSGRAGRVQAGICYRLISQNAFNQVRHHFYSHKMHLIKLVIISIRIDPTVIFSIFQLFLFFHVSWHLSSEFLLLFYEKVHHDFAICYIPYPPTHYIITPSELLLFVSTSISISISISTFIYRFFSFLPTLSQKCFVSHWRNLFYRSWPLILVIRTFS